MSVEERPINKNPVGLLRLLGISGSEGPDRLLSAIRGVVDLQPWWFAQLEQEQLFSVAQVANVASFITAVTVPAGQRWIITGMTSRTSASAAGHVVQIQNGIIPAATPTGLLGIGPPGPLQTFVAVAQRWSMAVGVDTRDKWFIANPGDQLGPFCVVQEGAAPNAATFLLRFAVTSL